MKHKYNVPNLLLSVLGYKGVPYPGMFVPPRPTGSYVGEDFETPGEDYIGEYEVKGTPLYAKNAAGTLCFMPVTIVHQGTEYELPEAVVSITGKKTVVSTPLVGRRGAVKELVSIDDYRITIAAFVSTRDHNYPTEQIEALKELWAINESVELRAVISDLVLDPGDRIVITDIEFPPTPGVEDGQAVKIACITDHDFELTIS